MAHEALEGFYKFQEQYFGKKVIREIIWINKGVDNLATYFLKNELRQAVDLTLELIVNQPKKIFRVHQKTIEYNKDFFKLLRQIRKINLEKLSNQKLASLYQKTYNLLQLSHGYSFYSTATVDSDGEDLTSYLLNYVKNQINKYKLKVNFAEAFSLLTTPTEYSFAQIETKESLEILEKIKVDKTAKKLFLTRNTAEIENNLDKIKSALKRKILNHFYKWQWTPYTYLGPAYELDYYLDIWRGILKQKINIAKELKELKQANQKNKKIKEKLFRKLKIESKYRQIFNLATEIVWLKAFRKDVLFFWLLYNG